MQLKQVGMHLEIFNPQKSYENSPELDFILTGIYEIPVENGKHLTLEGKIYFDEKREGILQTDSFLTWEEAFNLPNLNLNQISLRGHINDQKNYTLQYFSVHGLTVFGQDCYVE